MPKTKIIARGSFCRWQEPKRKTKKQSMYPDGVINTNFIIFFFLFLAGVFYVYSINNSAVKGYDLRSVEEDVIRLQKENEKLRIQEAELKSLHRVEESSKDLNMSEPQEISHIDELSPVAFRR